MINLGMVSRDQLADPKYRKEVDQKVIENLDKDSSKALVKVIFLIGSFPARRQINHNLQQTGRKCRIFCQVVHKKPERCDVNG